MATSTFYDNIVIEKEAGERLAKLLKEPSPPRPEPNYQNEFIEEGDERLERLHTILENLATQAQTRK